MKYNYNEEFDLDAIYQKLTSNRHAPMVKASDFFKQEDELTLLQAKMNAIMAQMRSRKHTAKSAR